MNKPDSNEPVQVIYDELEATSGHKGVTDSVGRMLRKVGPLDTSRLATGLSSLHQQIDTILESMGKASSAYELKTFEIVVDFTAKGEIRLIGAASGEFRGGIKLSFSKKA
jgi:hypothetical protein